MLAAMVVLLATGVVPPAVAGLLAACAIVLLRVLTVDQAYRAISWTTVILVGGDDPALDGDACRPARPATLADDLVRRRRRRGAYALLLGAVPAHRACSGS